MRINYSDLANIIEGMYFGGEEDFTYTEDLLEYLNDNEGGYAIINDISLS